MGYLKTEGGEGVPVIETGKFRPPPKPFPPPVISLPRRLVPTSRFAPIVDSPLVI